jgi:hypothetical protein
MTWKILMKLPLENLQINKSLIMNLTWIISIPVWCDYKRVSNNCWTARQLIDIIESWF